MLILAFGYRLGSIQKTTSLHVLLKFLTLLYTSVIDNESPVGLKYKCISYSRAKRCLVGGWDREGWGKDNGVEKRAHSRQDQECWAFDLINPDFMIKLGTKKMVGLEIEYKYIFNNNKVNGGWESIAGMH